MNIALLQLHCLAGHVSRNAALLRRAVQGAVIAADDMYGAHDKADTSLLCLAPELALSGAPLDRLAAAPGFLDACLCELRSLAAGLAEMPHGGPSLVLGCPDAADGEPASAMYLLHKGQVRRLCARPLDLALRFGPERSRTSTSFAVFETGGETLALWMGAADGAVDLAPSLPKDVTLCLNADVMPFEPATWLGRDEALRRSALSLGRAVMRVNPAGGNGSWIFPGGSVSMDAQGLVRTQAKPFAQELLLEHAGELLRPAAGTEPAACAAEASFSPAIPALWDALVTGLGDYVRHSGFSSVVLGLSGGMDSSLVAALAVEALGAEKVTGLLMPSPWSSQGSIDDALDLARNLGMTAQVVSIAPLMEAFDQALAPLFGDRDSDVTEENLQARIRGSLLMAMSNKFGHMLLSTGNKSEGAVGYGTLYGDLAGGLAPIVDVYKTEVYELARWYNHLKGREAIPQNVFQKPPSAELRPGQTDQDSLPPYDALDAFLRKEFLGDAALDNGLVHNGLAPEMAGKVRRMVRGSEFKRHQAAQPLFVSSHPLALCRRPLPVCQE